MKHSQIHNNNSKSSSAVKLPRTKPSAITQTISNQLQMLKYKLKESNLAALLDIVLESMKNAKKRVKAQ